MIYLQFWNMMRPSFEFKYCLKYYLSATLQCLLLGDVWVLVEKGTELLASVSNGREPKLVAGCQRFGWDNFLTLENECSSLLSKHQVEDEFWHRDERWSTESRPERRHELGIGRQRRSHPVDYSLDLKRHDFFPYFRLKIIRGVSILRTLGSSME